MPRLKTRPPKLCRDRQQAIVYLNGERVYLGTYGTDEAQRAYDKLIAEWLANDRELPAPTAEHADEPVIVTEVALAYWRHVKGRYSAGKVAAIRQAIILVRQLYGSEPAIEFGPKRLRVVRQAMIDGEPMATCEKCESELVDGYCAKCRCQRARGLGPEATSRSRSAGSERCSSGPPRTSSAPSPSTAAWRRWSRCGPARPDGTAGRCGPCQPATSAVCARFSPGQCGP